MGDAENFAQSLRSVLVLMHDIRTQVAAGREDSEVAAERLAAAMLGSTNVAAETAVTAATEATRRIDDALDLIDSSVDQLVGYATEVLGPGDAVGAPATSGDAGASRSAPATTTSTLGVRDRTAQSTPVCDIDNGESLRGATRAEVADAARRAGWTFRGRSRDGNGDVWVHPTKRGEQIIINDGYSWADDPVHRGPYVKVSRNGDRNRYPLNRSEE